jgi:transposase
MYIDKCKTGKYVRVLLRDSYRIDGKNRHHTILNLSKWPKGDVDALEFALKYNELSAFGYNRDGKKGKKQIVVGLLCEECGLPVSIEVFPGNTSDTRTVGSQVEKLSMRFGGVEITLVGDRGMIKKPQIRELAANGFHYITAITKPQIEKLLSDNTLQMELFDEDVAEVITETGERYICRRNPHRANEIRTARENKRLCIQAAIPPMADPPLAETKANAYISEHPRAHVEKALNNIQLKIRKLSARGGSAVGGRVDEWLKASIESGRINMTTDEDSLSEIEKLDGCYALKTDLTPKQADKHLIHARYKDLALVEQSFRTSKTVELEMRPIFLRRADNTRGHALVVMLAYLIVKELANCWASLDMTVQEGIDRLASLCETIVSIRGKGASSIVPEPRRDIKQLYDLAGITPPSVVPKITGERSDTKVKLHKRRKLV